MGTGKNFTLREATIDDFPYISQSAKQLTGITGFIKKSAFENRVIFFPGGQITLLDNDWPVLTTSAILVSSDFYRESYKFLRGPEAGYIVDHNPDGDTLFVFNIIPDTNKIDYSAYSTLLEFYKKFCKKNNIKKIVVSLQSYFYPDLFLEDNLKELIKKVESGADNHPVLSFIAASGFKYVKIVEHSGENEKFSDLIFEWFNFDFKAKLFYSRKKKSAGICAVQTVIKPARSFAEYSSRMKYFIELASSYKSDFVVFPELNIFSLLPEVIENSDIPLFISKYTPEYIEFFKTLAHKKNVNIISGSTIVKEEDKFYNVFFIFNRNGEIGKQKKIHLTRFEKEKLKLTPGNTVQIFETDICTVSVLSGYDIQFPEPARKVCSEDTKIIFVPYLTYDEKNFLKIKQTAAARCIENQVFTVIAGSSGKIPAISTDYLYAKSMVLTPLDFVFSKDGIAAESESNGENVILDDVNLELLRRNRRFGESSNWIDRRTDLYSISWNED